jgi:selenophosphate synthase
VSEKWEAKRDGAKLQKNSGRGKHEKGDATTSHFLIDYKEMSKSFTLNRKVWAKLCTDTVTSGPELIPVLKVILGEGNAKVRLAVIEYALLEELMEIYKKENS